MLQSILLILFTLLFLGLCWRNPRWGLLLTIVSLPSYLIRFQIGWLPMTLLELMILILFLVWFLKSIFNVNLWPRSKFAGPALLLLLISFIAIFISNETRAAAGIWKAYFLEPILLAIVFSGLIKEKEHLRNIIRALGISALLISLMAIIQKLTGGWLVPESYWLGGEGQRVTSFYSYPNAVGLYLGPIVMLFVGYFYLLVRDWKLKIKSPAYSADSADSAGRQKLLELIFSGLVIISSCLAIYWAKSEGALVALVIGLLVFGLLVKKTRWITVGVLLLVICCLLFAGVPTVLWEKLTFSDWSGQVRLVTWQETWQLLKDHWFLGVGLAGYQAALVPYHQADYLEIFLYPHNFVFNFWVELGLAGLLVFFYMIGKYFWYGIRVIKTLKHPSRRKRSEADENIKTIAVTLIAVMVVILVHGLVDVPYLKNDLAVLWWIFLGMMSWLVVRG